MGEGREGASTSSRALAYGAERGPAPYAPPRWARGRDMNMKAIHGWLLLLPAAVLLVAFTHYPTVATVLHSFFATPKGNRPAPFVGLENYAFMLEDPIFWRVLGNNLF